MSVTSTANNYRHYRQMEWNATGCLALALLYVWEMKMTCTHRTPSRTSRGSFSGFYGCQGKGYKATATTCRRRRRTFWAVLSVRSSYGPRLLLLPMFVCAEKRWRHSLLERSKGTPKPNAEKGFPIVSFSFHTNRTTTALVTGYPKRQKLSLRRKCISGAQMSGVGIRRAHGVPTVRGTVSSMSLEVNRVSEEIAVCRKLGKNLFFGKPLGKVPKKSEHGGLEITSGGISVAQSKMEGKHHSENLITSLNILAKLHKSFPCAFHSQFAGGVSGAFRSTIMLS